MTGLRVLLDLVKMRNHFRRYLSIYRTSIFLKRLHFWLTGGGCSTFKELKMPPNLGERLLDRRVCHWLRQCSLIEGLQFTGQLFCRAWKQYCMAASSWQSVSTLAEPVALDKQALTTCFGTVHDLVGISCANNHRPHRKQVKDRRPRLTFIEVPHATVPSTVPPGRPPRKCPHR